MSPRRSECGVSNDADCESDGECSSCALARLWEAGIPAAANAEDCWRNFRLDDGMTASLLRALAKNARNFGAGRIDARTVPRTDSSAPAKQARRHYSDGGLCRTWPPRKNHDHVRDRDN